MTTSNLNSTITTIVNTLNILDSVNVPGFCWTDDGMDKSGHWTEWAELVEILDPTPIVREVSLETFISLTIDAGIVGLPSGLKPSGLWEFLKRSDKVVCEVGQKGQTISRAYWMDDLTVVDGEEVWSYGGCISVVGDVHPHKLEEFVYQAQKRVVGNPKSPANISAIVEVEMIMDEVKNGWVSEDGSLTMNGEDVLDAGKHIIDCIRGGDDATLWNMYYDSDTCYTYADMNRLIDIASSYTEPFMFAEWRKLAKAHEDETPRNLVKRRFSEGMTMSLTNIPCPPDREGRDWLKEVGVMRRELLHR